MNLENLKEISVLGFQFDENNVVKILISSIHPRFSIPRGKSPLEGGEEKGDGAKTERPRREEAGEGSSFFVEFVFF